jgi:hypothetical protein
MSRPLAIVIAIVIAACLRAAPLPFPKPAKPADLLGRYDVTWRGGEWFVTLHAGGVFESVPVGGSPWLGTWRAEGGELIVSESPAPGLGDVWPPERWQCEWSVKLPAGPEGSAWGEAAEITMRKLDQKRGRVP